MKKSIIKFILVFVSVGFFTGCTEVVDVDLANGGNRLVVEASILWEKGTVGNEQTIKLSTSTPYFSENQNTPVVNATVQVTNTDTGEVFVFTNQNNGEYTTTTFNPILNNEYALEVVYNGNTYRGTEIFIPVTDITKVEQETRTTFGGSEELQVKVFFNDEESETNFYLGRFKASNIPIPDLEARDDEFINGNESFIQYRDEDLEVGSIVAISLQGISRQYFNYIDLLIEQLGQGGPFQSTPARLRGNCINVNNSNEEVFGYFRLSEIVNENYTIN
ncbi:DUF4249 domain-containing protein [Tenacibaculum amylolyticum]|uniref:DUF4249 domain-containing protein n=1 Tax=Tenacibaculum amylolyticum TaxID=104269 RepID=UPI003894BFEC